MRQIILTMGFVPSRIWAKSCEQIYKTRTTNIEHVFVEHHYPVRKEQNREELHAICRAHGIRVIAPDKNLGLHAGLNWAISTLHLSIDDLLLGVDPDTYPVESGWDRAIFDVLLSDPSVGWAGLSNIATPNEVRDRAQHISEGSVAGHRLYRCATPMLISIAGIRLSWVLDGGGFQEPTAYYGGLECAMWPHMWHAKQQLVLMQDFHEDDTVAHEQDEPYRLWKVEHVHGRFPGNFDEYCAVNGIA